ncbi:unnamed protein product [Closterium sp. NIES-54]
MADAETSETDVAKNRQLIEASREGDLAAVMRLIKNKSPNLKPSTLSWPTPVQITSPHSDYTKHSQYPFSRFLNNSPSLPHLHPPLPKPPSPSPPPPPTPPLPPGPFPPVAPFCALQPLREGADVAYADVDAQGRTALMAAAEGGRAEVVRALLGEGAVWNAVDMGGKSAGDYAMEGVVAWGEGEGEEGEDESKKEEKARRQEVLDALIDAGTAVVCGVGKGGDEHGERGEKKGGWDGRHASCFSFPFLSISFPSLSFRSLPVPFLSVPSSLYPISYMSFSHPSYRKPIPSLSFPSLSFLPFPSLPFPSLPFPSLPFPFLSFLFRLPLTPFPTNRSLAPHTGIKAELILGAASRNLTRGSTAPGAAEQLAPAPNAAYLSERLQLSESRLVDGEGGGVMMKWEGALMQAHGQAICQQVGTGLCCVVLCGARCFRSYVLQAGVETVRLVDGEGGGVMMKWEGALMQAHV